MNTTKNNEIYNKHAMHIRAHEHRDLSGVKSNDTTTKQTHCHNLHMETTFSIQLRMKYYMTIWQFATIAASWLASHITDGFGSLFMADCENGMKHIAPIWEQNTIAANEKRWITTM